MRIWFGNVSGSSVRGAASHLLALRIDPLGDGEIGGFSPVVVSMKGNLRVIGAARESPIEDLSEIMDLMPTG
jgi:hypothetical protein